MKRRSDGDGRSLDMTSSFGGARIQGFTIGSPDQLPQPARFSLGHPASKRREPIRAPPVGAAEHRVPDPAVLEQPLDDAVQRAGAQPDRTVRPLLDFLDDGVAVLFTVGERQQDMEQRRGQRQGVMGVAQV